MVRGRRTDEPALVHPTGDRPKKSEHCLERIIAFCDREPDEDLPDQVYIHDENSFEAYKLLEAFADGYGGYRIRDVLGKPLVELDERLVQDLMTWRWMGGIIERQKMKKLEKKQDE